MRVWPISYFSFFLAVGMETAFANRIEGETGSYLPIPPAHKMTK